MKAALGCLGLAALFASMPAGRADEGGLGRTWAKLDAGKGLTLGYLGGSITQGAGASDSSKTSWRALTTAWFREQFPRARIDEINAGLGGTGSDLGAFRCGRDLLARKPDLVFVEFAVNDQGAAEARARYYEGIIRQIREADPATDIVPVYTVAKAGDVYPQGKVPPSVLSEQEIARHYGLSGVNVGQALSQAIQSGQGTWETMTRDGTHPDDAGYRLYADAVIAFLQAHRGDAAAGPEPLPAPLHDGAVDKAAMVDAWTVAGAGWTQESQSLAGAFPHRLSSNTPGAEIHYAFEGTTVGLTWLVAPDSGKIVYQIDDGPPQAASSWDVHALTFTRPSYVLLAENLPPGSHTLRVQVSAEKDPASTGTWIRLGALLVH